ncbi:MAG: glycoside hydrolase [Odoribacter sp.]|nr:glycoside hydrolase [Odoribacter sp.]
MKKTTLMLGVLLLFSVVALFSCKDDDEPKVFGVVTAKMIAGDGRSYNCVVETDRLINSADSMKMGTDLSAISLELEASMGTEMYYNNEPLTKETVLNLTEPVTIQARNGGDVKAYRVEAVVQTAEGAKVSSDMTATGLRKFNSYDIVSFKGKFYCIGADIADKAVGSATYYQVYSSEDGETWTKVNTNPKVIGGYGTKLAVLNNTLFAFGGVRYGLDEDGVENSEDGWMGAAPISTDWSAWSTTDGTNWTNLVTGEEEAGTVPRGRMFANICVHNGKICMNGGNQFGFGMFQSMGEANLWTTTDGKTWEQVVPAGESSPYRYAETLFSFDGKLWTLGGVQSFISASQMKNDIWSSADGGVTWVQEVADVTTGAAGDFTPRWGAKVAEHNGVLYMIGGNTFDAEGAQAMVADILRSTDGKMWTVLEEEEQLPGFEGRVNPILVNGDGSLLWIFGGVKEYTGSYGEASELWYDAWQKVIK